MQFLVPAMLLVLVVNARATDGVTTRVYKTVDEAGVVSFSDTPPRDDAAPREILHIDTPRPMDPDGYRDQLESMRESTDRMAESRREREKHRAELRESQARYRAAQPQPYPDEDYYPASYRYPWYNWRPWQPGFRPPRPEHPILHPPLRPGIDHIGSRNSQLMRPLVSSGKHGSGSSNAQLMRPLVSTPP